MAFELFSVIAKNAKKKKHNTNRRNERTYEKRERNKTEFTKNELKIK